MARESVVALHVSKKYQLHSGKRDRFRGLFLSSPKGRTFCALSDISFHAEEGDCIGLVGLNGSGKSTLADMLGGISVPTDGTVTLRGEPSIISIASGLSIQMSGMENIEMKGLMMGLTKKEIDGIRDSIIEFADIGEFIHQPVKTYSSGMRARLGFAIAVNISPDILVIDEALSVGDPTFTQRCYDKMYAFKQEHKTIFFVSHNLNEVERYCDKVLWLDYGILRAYGTAQEVLPVYGRYINRYYEMSEAEQTQYRKKMQARQITAGV